MAWMVLLMAIVTLLPFLGLNNAAATQLDSAYKQRIRHSLQTAFSPLVYCLIVNVARICKRIYVASALCPGTDCVVGKHFLLLCSP